MSGIPFHYYLASAADRVDESGDVWRWPLPDSPAQHLDDTASKRAVPTYGDYFTAVRRFLEADDYRVAVRALFHSPDTLGGSDSIRGIHVFLVKHGAFYHPCRIEIHGATFHEVFAVNVAVSEVGKGCIRREFHLIQRLNAAIPAGFLPLVFDYADIVLEKHLEFKMFLAQWCDGFHEFHMAFDHNSLSFGIHVWNPDRGNTFLSAEQTHELYRRIAVILTTYYNPESFEQVFPWHHAAGDFVVRCSDSGVDVRLITVRQYAAMYASEAEINDARLEAMLVFLINLSIRTRIDRSDGVGNFVWARPEIVDATVQGFLECLLDRHPGYHHMFIRLVRSLDIGEYCETVVNSYNPDAPELPMILHHLSDHVDRLQNVLAACLKK